jgi:hypothetical protein
MRTSSAVGRCDERENYIVMGIRGGVGEVAPNAGLVNLPSAISDDQAKKDWLAAESA